MHVKHVSSHLSSRNSGPKHYEGSITLAANEKPDEQIKHLFSFLFSVHLKHLK